MLAGVISLVVISQCMQGQEALNIIDATSSAHCELCKACFEMDYPDLISRL